MLKKNFRNPAVLVNKLNRIVYKNKLQHSNSRTGILRWHNHNFEETKYETSLLNLKEAEMIFTFYERLARRAGNKKIMITSFYSAQIKTLRDMFTTRLRPQDKIISIDSSQGTETDIMLISCVRNGKNGIGFCKDKRRLNVAISRAKEQLHLFGYKPTFERNSRNWKKLCKNI